MDLYCSPVCLLFTGIVLLSQSFGQEFVSDPGTQEVVQHSNVSFLCRIKSLGVLNVVWMRSGSVLTLNQMTLVPDTRMSVQRLKMKDSSYKYDLRIVNVTTADEGNYTCQVTSVPPLEQKSTLVVTVPPTITDLKPASAVEATLGNTVPLHCKATGKPRPNITWTRQDDLLPDGRELKEGGTLKLKNLKYNHGGVYKCTASNGVGAPAEDSVTLNVVYPPVIHSKISRVFTGPGEVTVLPCVISGQPKPTVVWWHNNTRLRLRELPQRKELVVEEKGFRLNYGLKISEVTDSDLGTYNCTVKNSMGSETTFMTLTAVPGKVEIMSYENGAFSRQYPLRWNVTAVVSPVRYSLTLKKIVNETYIEDLGDTDIDASPAKDGHIYEQTYDIMDLEPETTYEVTLTAQNRYGPGETSEDFVFRTNKDEGGNTNDNNSAGSVAFSPLLVSTCIVILKSFRLL